MDVDFKDPQLTKYYWTTVLIFTAVAILLALFYSWNRNIKNKAKYAMEDYQRDLTNSLAHDIKTPLMAIGGYTENIIEGDLSDDEKQKYLHSILDNVAFTDSMINRALLLNSMGSEKKLKREKIDVADTVEKSIDKYTIMLDEKNIAFKINGNAEISTDISLFSTIIENIISNAVKYTPENGVIKADINKKQLTFSNSVDKKIDTKNLKQPFVRADKARSNTDGSGLGLSIADRAAYNIGQKLSIFCTDNEFKVELRF